MNRSHLQLEADRHASALRRGLAEDLRRMRQDAGLTQAAVAGLAGIDPSILSRAESETMAPTLETYARVAAALGADLAARVYPNTGPKLQDRHSVRMADLLLASAHPRWHGRPEVGVRRPVRGWVDIVLRDPATATIVATELESLLRRIEQLIRWGQEKAEALPSSREWPAWCDRGEPQVSRLLVVRWTRANRAAAADARRTLALAYPADPRDTLESLTSTVAWPGPGLLWARIDGGGRPELDARPP